MSPAPPPPPPAPPSTAVPPVPPVPPVPASDRVRPGQLTRPWQVATLAMWGLTMLAFVGIWKASGELGLATWWTGPESEPQPFFVVLAPFYLPSFVVVAALSNSRWVPWLGLAAGLVTALIGLGDLGDVARYGVVEIAIGGAGIVFSLASLSGRYRRPARGTPEGAVSP